MNASARQLFKFFIDTKSDLDLCRIELASVQEELASKEGDMKKTVGYEILRVTTDFEKQRAIDQDTIVQTEYQMEQMSETLRSLNGIFKAMQSDGSAARTSGIYTFIYIYAHTYIYSY
jgi:hypothetical protein